MLKIEIEDLLAVLKLCYPYFIAIGIIILIATSIMIIYRKLPKGKKMLVIGETIIAMIMAIIIVVNAICFGPMSTLIGLSTGSGSISEKTMEEAKQVAEKVMDEGIVLLENKESLLPLKEINNINLFGWASINPSYGGSGSGGINDLYPIVSLTEGLENYGFNINNELMEFYNNYTSERPEMSIQKQSWTLPEPPVSNYSDEMIQNAKEFSGVAIIVISRMAGEGHNDIPMDVSQSSYDNNSSEYADFEEGEHYLQLSQTEEDMMKLVCENFEDVVVIYNGANPIEMGFVNMYNQIKSVLWCPGTGNVGFNSLGKILKGEVNPSGKLTDTFVYNYKDAPWWNNANKRNYENLEDMSVEGMNSGKPQVYYPSFVNYVEGIYVGYKFYETAVYEGIINYEETVQYPFGYGLSYTTFTQVMSDIKENNGKISFDVTVTNTGDIQGKDVIEVYYNPPYNNGGIEKATANLIAFDKTDLLEPGESQTLTIEFSKEEMASYDSDGEGAYVLEKGQYIISINTDSHNIIGKREYIVDKDIVYDENNKRESDKIVAQNAFDDIEGNVTYLSRKDGFNNLKEAIAEPKSLNMDEEYAKDYHVNSNYDYTEYLNDEDKMPVTGAKNGIVLADLRGADYDDPLWDKLLDQLEVDEMANLIAMAGYQTAPVKSVGKLGTIDCDGPAAINNSFTGVGSIGFPVEVVLACSWNEELANIYGECMGKMCKEMDVQGWYAPGMNTHRTAFGARNYEYFSEDGVLAGKISANTVLGAMKQGVYSYIKHFALYEGNAKMVCVWANEQAIREIYLKPFEISVKEGKANAVMTSWSYIGNKWSGENSNLINGVLRDEWGFRGMVLTDFFRNNGQGFMNADIALANGVDAMLSTFNGEANNVTDLNHPTAVKEMRQACKNIMYTVVSSWIYDNDSLEVGIEPWKKAAIIIDSILGILLVVSAVLVYKKSKKISSNTESYN